VAIGDVVATYAAIVSTALLGWTIFASVRTKVSCSVDLTYPDWVFDITDSHPHRGAAYARIVVTNTGQRPVSVKEVGLTYHTRRAREEPGRRFLLHELPITIEPSYGRFRFRLSWTFRRNKMVVDVVTRTLAAGEAFEVSRTRDELHAWFMDEMALAPLHLDGIYLRLSSARRMKRFPIWVIDPGLRDIGNRDTFESFSDPAPKPRPIGRPPIT
jgi:hypothetical protein